MTDGADGNVDDPEPVSEQPSVAGAAPEERRWRRLRWVFTRRLSFGGLAGALVFFCISMSPSLVPRSSLMQGVVSGICVAIGYGLGSALLVAIRRLRENEPSPRFKRAAWTTLAAATLLFGGIFVAYGIHWQSNLRDDFGMESRGAAGWPTIIILTVVVAAIVLVISRLVRGFTRGLISLLDRIFPHQVTVALSLGLVVILMLALVQGALLSALTSGMNSVYSVSDKGTKPGITQPSSPLRTAGEGSLIEWDSLGSKGRDFVGDGGGPTVDQIEAFTGRAALEPIRVYVGLRSADDIDDRVDLALEELERTGAFERSYIVVNTTTGTGWVDENVADSFEFMHGGDTAQVAMQYSYLPSWVSFLVDRSTAEEAGEKMITAVVDRVQSIPEPERPTLYAFGESLGSFGTESAFTSPENMLSNLDGAMLVGPTFVNPLHEELVDERDGDSPAWRPIVDDGESFRFAVEPDDLDDASLYDDPESRDGPRIVYLQNSSDPITYFNTDLILTEPEWLQGETGPDVSSDMAYIPFVTFFQVAADMAFAMDVPDGHGHRYGANVVDGWAEVSAPAGWTDDDTDALRELIEQRAVERGERQAAG